MQDILNKFADDMRSLEGRHISHLSTENTYNSEIDLTVSLLDDLGMIPASSTLRRIEKDHLQEQIDILAKKHEEMEKLNLDY